MRCTAIASSLEISARNAVAILVRRVRMSPVAEPASKYACGSWASHAASTAARNSDSLSVKWLYTVSFETPASAATVSMLTPS